MKPRRLAALLLALLLTAGLFVPQASAAAGTVYIRSEEDLLFFSKKCALDTWSQGKTVYLAADLDLTHVDFSPIPTFGGTFDGGGHTILGLRLSGAGSRQGLFRTIQAGGVVRDLTVRGVVMPAGTREMIGGLAGVNFGAVQNCVFNGTVEGQSAVGGLVGLNEITGEIVNCVSKGSVQGESGVGGVAGRNLGALIRCENHADVNIRERKTTQSLADLDVTIPIEQITGEYTGRSENLTEGHSDVGGVVGFTSGAVQSCVNRGKVGYPHVGYNIGGVAGRQTGYMDRCVNYGQVLGRKDVGGVVGQAEPEISVNIDMATLNSLTAELEKLNFLIHQTLGEMDDRAAGVSERLEAASREMDAAKEGAQSLAASVGDTVDANVAAVNLFSATVTGALEEAREGLASFSEAAEAVSAFSEALTGAFEKLSAAGEDGAAMFRKMELALEQVRLCGEDVRGAIGLAVSAVNALEQAVVIRDAAKVSQAASDLSKAISASGGAMSDMAAAVKALGVALAGIDVSWDGTGWPTVDMGTVAAAIGPAADALQDMGGALGVLGGQVKAIGDALLVIEGEVDVYPQKFTDAATDTKSALVTVTDAIRHFEDAAYDLQLASKEAGDVTGQLAAVMDDLAAAAERGSAIGSALAEGFAAFERSAGALTDGARLELVPLGEDARAASESLFNALDGMSGEMQALNEELLGAEGALSGDLGAVADQFHVVFALLIDALYDLRMGETAEKLGIHIEDVSDETLDAIRQGKVSNASNYGAVDGDRNVGGVVGSMAIEYDRDPEDDASATRLSYYATYETRAVLQGCVSDAPVTAKKDCVGGVAGRVDLGTVIDCQGYGTVESTGGDYVGGIAGYAASGLRSSYARCRLAGKDYVGGVAGSCVTMRDCVALPTLLRGGEYLGALAGCGDVTTGKITGNLFLEGDLAAVDSVSYSGLAQPASYAELQARKEIPPALLKLSLILRDEGETDRIIPIQYGEDLRSMTLPEPQTKEGCYGAWPALPDRVEGDIVLEAAYRPLISLLASRETEGVLPLVLADGAFTREAVLRAAAEGPQPPKEGGRVLTVTLENGGLPAGADLPVRILAGEDETVYLLGAKGWEKAEGTQNGKYFRMTLPAAGGTVAVTRKSGPDRLPILLGAGIGGGVAVAAVAAALLGRKKKKATFSAGGEEG